MSAQLLTECGELAVAAVNAVLQGLCITAVVALVLKCCGRINAATRYVIWYSSLLLVLGLFPANYFVRQEQKPETVSLNTVSRGVPTPPLRSESVPAESEITSAENAALKEEPAESETAQNSEEPTSDLEASSAAILSETPVVEPELSLQQSLLASTSTLSEKAGVPTPILHRQISLTAEAGAVLLLIWVALATIRLLVLAIRLLRLRASKYNATTVDSGLQTLLHSLREQVGTTRNVELRHSNTYRSPLLVGFMHPTILVPTQSLSSRDDLNPVLLHELAHLKRYDDWTNLLQNAIQAVLFFHPGVWWIAKELSWEREIACDDYVLQKGLRAQSYARTLANVAAKISGFKSLPQLAPGISTDKTQLTKRISMILNTNRDTSARLARTKLGLVGSAVVIAAALAVYAAPRAVRAQSAVAGLAPAATTPTIAVAGTPAPAGIGSIVIAANESEDEPGVPPGPKAKPGEGAGLPATPDLAPPPAPMHPGHPPVHPVQPLVVIRGHPAPAAMALNAPDGPQSEQLEQRLSRLERMMEKLLARQDGKKMPGQGFEMNMDMNWDMAKKMEREKQFALAEANRAKEEGKRAREDVRRQMERNRQMMHDLDRARKDGAEHQLEGLRHQRDALSHQLEMLNKEIEHLEQRRQEHSELDREQHDDDSQDVLLGKELTSADEVEPEEETEEVEVN